MLTSPLRDGAPVVHAIREATRPDVAMCGMPVRQTTLTDSVPRHSIMASILSPLTTGSMEHGASGTMFWLKASISAFTGLSG
jgi:hypothetical protein